MDKRWGVYAPVIDDLKVKAKQLGLWNIFLSKTHYSEGAGLTNLEYGLIAMALGKSGLASQVNSWQKFDAIRLLIPTARLSIVLHQTLAIWRFLRSMDPRNRRNSGWSLFWMVQSDPLSS
jgi:hypothetical protein